jgi:hypothetical protein
MKRRAEASHITASELADCSLCEQRFLFDIARGHRRSAASRRAMAAGTQTHAALHGAALREIARAGTDGRCCIAMALWGPIDTRTHRLRDWRDQYLMVHLWGRTVARMYYAVSPSVIAMLAGRPRLRAALDAWLSVVVRSLP